VESAVFNFVQRVHQQLVEVDVFHSGETEDGDQEVTQLLAIRLVLLGGEIEALPAVFGQVGARHLADLFYQAQDHDRAVLFRVALAFIDVTEHVEVLFERGGKVLDFRGFRCCHTPIVQQCYNRRMFEVYQARGVREWIADLKKFPLSSLIVIAELAQVKLGLEKVDDSLFKHIKHTVENFDYLKTTTDRLTAVKRINEVLVQKQARGGELERRTKRLLIALINRFSHLKEYELKKASQISEFLTLIWQLQDPELSSKITSMLKAFPHDEHLLMQHVLQAHVFSLNIILNEPPTKPAELDSKAHLFGDAYLEFVVWLAANRRIQGVSPEGKTYNGQERVEMFQLMTQHLRYHALRGAVAIQDREELAQVVIWQLMSKRDCGFLISTLQNQYQGDVPTFLKENYPEIYDHIKQLHPRGWVSR
jgi:hypothetical protein